MRTRKVRPKYVAQTTKYAWAVLGALVVALILGAFIAPAGVAAKSSGGAPSDLLATKVRLEYAQYRGRGGASASESLATKVRVDYAQYRGRGGFAESNPLAENPELVYARAYSAGQGIALSQTTATSLLAANPELVYARAFGLGQNTATSLLAANPELVYSRGFGSGQSTALGQGSGVAACVLGQDYSSLAANPELVYTTTSQVC